MAIFISHLLISIDIPYCLSNLQFVNLVKVYTKFG